MIAIIGIIIKVITVFVAILVIKKIIIVRIALGLHVYK